VVDWSLYTAPEEQITADLLRTFIDEQREARLLAESMTLELKERRHGDNIAKAVAGFANTEGGVVLVGISENNPSFETAPGVSPNEVVAIGDSCRNLLTPLVRPSIVPVALPDGENVVVVVRVDSDASLVPVCKAGAVFVRAPGQTVPASREQIIALATRPQGAATALVPSLSSAFAPSYEANRDETRDALVRVASAVWLRKSVHDFVFGTSVRESLRARLDATPFFLYPAQTRFEWRRPENRPHCVDSGFTANNATFVVDYPGDDATYRVTAHFRKDGYRIAYALDLELRVRTRGDLEPETRLGRAELSAALLMGLETAALILPDELATAAGSAPQRIDAVHVWAQNPGQSFDTLLDLSHTHRASQNPMGSQWGWERSAPRTLDEVTHSVRTELERLYLDIGLTDAEVIADEDVQRGLAERSHVLDEVITTAP
jgi:hypothetical protein